MYSHAYVVAEDKFIWLAYCLFLNMENIEFILMQCKVSAF